MSDRGFLNVTVEGNANRLILHLDALPDELQAALKAKIGEFTNALLLEVKAAEPHRTGRLRNMTRAFVDEGENWVRGRVRVINTNDKNFAEAAGALEYGAPGKRGRFAVSAYHRGSGIVSAYHRRAHIRAQRFLRGPASALRPKALAQLEAIINQTIAKNLAQP